MSWVVNGYARMEDRWRDKPDARCAVIPQDREMATGWIPDCVICFVLDLDRSPAMTLISGDAICGAHIKLRAKFDTLQTALADARAELERTGRRKRGE